MNLFEWFKKGMTAQEYVESMQVNQETLRSIYHTYQLSQEAENVTQAVTGKGIKAIVLTADWCGDAMVNIPILLKLANNSLMECRFLIRDENVELMDRYLTNGTARSIPIIIFINEKGEEIAKWGPRAAAVEEIVSNYKALLPEKDSPQYELAFKETFIPKMHQLFKQETTWATIEKDLVQVFRQL
ncbi:MULTISPECIES: thioredoxin family protein [Shouchella]|uniref:Thioredoxin family protein n=2 Tax=Shouchella TaxID=2893057 RepID=A0ABY7W6E2_9BACI|nr:MULTISPECIES: thioredoxin family protein [Shouchella]MED4126774.1 thioredoxin family protein [Shouchella miscanthi]WDF04505.1 thioredoxin family protein [Shouchella hunanensis]